VVFCSGKVYFDLLQARRREALREVALVRIEQLYPFPSEEYQAVLDRYPSLREVVWCQEEPQNQGAWYQIRHRLQELVPGRRTVLYAGRPPAAAPATGLPKIHELEQQALVAAALHSMTAEESGRDTMRLKALTPGTPAAAASAPAAATSVPAPATAPAAPGPTPTAAKPAAPATPLRKRS
jgi:2-oxoglutarate dehydrogenase E1 component